MYYVMSDIHGCHDEFMAALTHWNRETETLVVLGDLIDRGPKSMQVVQTLRSLKEVYGNRVIVLKGNHDEMFANWLMESHPDDLGFYYMPNHNETIQSFFGDIAKYKNATRKQRGEHILHLYKKDVRFLYELPLYYETKHCIFVHAGINLKLADHWRDDLRCMNWIRNEFIHSKTVAPKTTFFGHTPTALIRNADETTPGSHDVWMSDLCDKIGIDGGVSMNGQLNALKVDEFGNVTDVIVIKAGTAPAVPETTQLSLGSNGQDDEDGKYTMRNTESSSPTSTTNR